MSNGANDTGEIHGFDCEFDPEVDRKYHCPICLAVLRDAVQTVCGHRFCDKCLKGVIRDRTCAKCPVDNTWFRVRGEMFADNATRREVLSLLVRCSHKLADKRCQWKGELRQLQVHASSCPIAPLQCEYNCGKTVTRGEMGVHKTICRRRPVPCDHCDLMLPWADKPKHHLLDCEKFPVTCTSCGGVGIIRKNIAEHLELECPLVEVQCLFFKLGCKAEEKRQNMEKHNKDHWQKHMMLMMERMTRMNTEMHRGQRTIEQLSDQLREQECVMDVQRRELSAIGDLVYKTSDSALEPTVDTATRTHSAN